MRALFLTLSLGSILAFGVRGQDAQPASPAPLQKFEGTAPLTTPGFTVADKWEVRWTATRNVNISVIRPDGMLVAGATSFRGALYIPKGGNYHLQIDCAPPPEI